MKRLTVEERKELFKTLAKECDEIMEGKQPGYTNEGLANDNFWNDADELGIRPEQVLLVHMNKHARSIKLYIKKDGKVVDPEPISKRIEDNINYLKMLWTIFVEQDRIKVE
jgi:hypothetical protein